MIRLFSLCLLAACFAPAFGAWTPEPLDAQEMQRAESMYQTYCALCHDTDRSGYRADHAPSLRSRSLLSTGLPGFVYQTIGWGRANTAMEGYSTDMGGPLSRQDILLLTQWLGQVEGIEVIDLPQDTIVGDVELGGRIYAKQCASCHGVDGQGVNAPSPDDYVLNPEGEAPEFTLRAGRYVPAAQVVAALEEKRRFILLDTRPASAWQRSHIPGAVPMPYYRDRDRAGENLPRDGTWIVAYCACPHAASDFVIDNLKEQGFENLAVIDEGILRWTAMGLPVTAGGELSGTD